MREAVIAGSRARKSQAWFSVWMAAAFVLVIACANVANLTLMRGVRREHELVVRAALGAGTARLRRLLLAENLVLATAGGVLGLGVALAEACLLHGVGCTVATPGDDAFTDLFSETTARAVVAVRPWRAQAMICHWLTRST